jgi:hypothetical protein
LALMDIGMDYSGTDHDADAIRSESQGNIKGCWGEGKCTGGQLGSQRMCLWRSNPGTNRDGEAVADTLGVLRKSRYSDCNH